MNKELISDIWIVFKNTGTILCVNESLKGAMIKALVTNNNNITVFPNTHIIIRGLVYLKNEKTLFNYWENLEPNYTNGLKISKHRIERNSYADKIKIKVREI
jgi:hypothetical protein